MNAPVIDYITEEVRRQGHDVTALDGIERVGWMLAAWACALELSVDLPTISITRKLGQLVEREKNWNGWRQINVRVGMRRCPDFEKVPDLLFTLFAKRETLSPLEFYREFEMIHPFVDGNGRVGKILLNWLSGKLLNPEFPPDDFWGQVIQNP